MIYDKKNNDQKQEINYLKAKTFLEKKLPVHILKTDREWFNGDLKEVRSDFLIINEFKKGQRILFFLEIYDINEYIKKGCEDGFV
jgi:hypothetical protein